MSRPLSPKQKAALEKGRGKAGTEKATEARMAKRAAEAELLDEGSPDEVLLEMFKEAGRAATRGLRKWNNAGGEPSRQTIDAVKEARQLALTARDILIERGTATQADAFFDELTARIERANFGPVACPNCGEQVSTAPPAPQPVEGPTS